MPATKHNIHRAEWGFVPWSHSPLDLQGPRHAELEGSLTNRGPIPHLSICFSERVAHHQMKNYRRDEPWALHRWATACRYAPDREADNATWAERSWLIRPISTASTVSYCAGTIKWRTALHRSPSSNRRPTAPGTDQNIMPGDQFACNIHNLIARHCLFFQRRIKRDNESCSALQEIEY
jgi:hypothetical protein